jgi:SAM-dependent methyltransferase
MLAAYLREAKDPDVLCVVMDAMSQHVAEGAFDLVTGASILHHLDAPDKGVVAAARALKPGGQAIFFEPFNGWAVLRLAFERILAEAALRGEALEPVVHGAVTQLVSDVADRTRLDRVPADLIGLDDKWLFSRTRMEKVARAAGFSDVQFVPHNDHSTLYRDTVAVHLRLYSGRDDLALPAWAAEIIDSYDAAMPLQAKRELMLEGSIVLTKGG